MVLDGFEMESNVAGDVLSTASQFGSVPKALAEYVANSIGNGQEGQAVQVRVTKRQAYGGGHRIVITDNARGMDATDLRRFFTMHAENQSRRRGQWTGGRFGTGKSAAFGIGKSLQVETCRDGLKWIVRLEKAELESAKKDQRKPQLITIVDAAPTKERNGTTIIIEGITKPADASRIISGLRRRLGRNLNAHEVTILGSRATIEEPKARRSWTFASKDHGVQDAIGLEVACTIRAAMQGPVDETIRGIVVTAKGFPVAQLIPSGDYGSRIFGLCEVPALEEDDSTPGPYTDSRDSTLNEENRTAGPLAQWLRECLEQVTRDLATEDREQRRRAHDAALRNAASRMEAVLNRHYQGEFRRTRSLQNDIGTRQMGPAMSVPDVNGDFVQPGEGFTGYDIPTESKSSTETDGSTSESDNSEQGPVDSTAHARERDPFGEGRGEPVGPREGPRPQRNRGSGFIIGFEKAGEEAPRCNYLAAVLTIMVNLDHPELAAAYKEGDTSLFRMLTFEAAAQEYSFATAYQRLEDDNSLDASDILQYVRQTMESLTRDVSDVIADLVTAPLPVMAAAG